MACDRNRLTKDDLEHLDASELDLEFLVRQIKGSFFQQLTQLKDHLKKEENNESVGPTAHVAALKNPRREVNFCTRKFSEIRKDLESHMKHLDASNLELTEESLKRYRARLLHIIGRMKRISSSQVAREGAMKLLLVINPFMDLLKPNGISIDDLDKSLNALDLEPKEQELLRETREEEPIPGELEIIPENHSRCSSVDEQAPSGYRTFPPNMTSNHPGPLISNFNVPIAASSVIDTTPPQCMVRNGNNVHLRKTTYFQDLSEHRKDNYPDRILSEQLNQIADPRNPSGGTRDFNQYPNAFDTVNVNSINGDRRRLPYAPSTGLNTPFEQNRIPAYQQPIDHPYSSNSIIPLRLPNTHYSISLSREARNLRFNGSLHGLSIEKFLYRFETVTGRHRIPLTELVDEIGAYLEDVALEFYWNYRQNNPKSSWYDLRDAMRSQFQDCRDDFEIRRMLENRKQRTNEHFSEFYTQIRKLSMQLNVSLPENELVMLLARNMKPTLQDRLSGILPRNLNELVRCCVAIEDNWARFNSERPPKKHVNEVDFTPNIYGFQEPTSYIDAIKPSYSKLKCWNCAGPHVYQDCTESARIFCFGCGNPNILKPNCPNCKNRMSGNSSMEMRNAGRTHFQKTQNPSPKISQIDAVHPNPNPFDTHPQV